MPLSGNTPLELGIGFLLATIFFIAGAGAPMRLSVGLLLLLAPFQLASLIDVTSNMAMAFTVAIGLQLRGTKLKIPLTGSMLIVLLSYLVSISQVDPSLYRLHAVALIILSSGFVVFILAYNLARNTTDARDIVSLLLAGNVLINLYCMVQFVLGPGASTSILGLEELTTEANRGEGDPRLGGPFGGAPGILAQYLALITLIVVYETIHSGAGRRRRLWLLIAWNLALIVATGNRGGFVTLMVGAAGLVIMNRRQLGTIRTIQLAMGGLLALAVSTLVITRFTGFNVFVGRMESITDNQGGIPQTRVLVWPEAWHRFLDVPWFGQGPTWRLPMEHLGATFPGHIYIEYPHSLYLYLLVSVGVVGTAAFAWFFVVLGRKLLHASRTVHYESTYVDGLVRLGPLLLVLFLLDQIRIEFLRPVFADYQHFVFGLFGLWLGLAHRRPVRELAPVEESQVQKVPVSRRSLGAAVTTRGQPDH